MAFNWQKTSFGYLKKMPRNRVCSQNVRQTRLHSVEEKTVNP